MRLISYIGHIECAAMCAVTGDLRWCSLARWHHTDGGPQWLGELVPLVGRERGLWWGQPLWHSFSPSPVKRSFSSPVEHGEMIAGNEKILSQRVKWNSWRVSKQKSLSHRPIFFFFFFLDIIDSEFQPKSEVEKKKQCRKLHNLNKNKNKNCAQ